MYDYSKIKVGDRIVCINDSIIGLASFTRYGQEVIVLSIDPDGLCVNSWNEEHYKKLGGYTYGDTIYKGTI